MAMFYLLNLVGSPVEARAVAYIRAKGTKKAMTAIAQERGGQTSGWIVAKVTFHYDGVAHEWERVWP